jgi:hypothetical protein
MQTLEMGNNTLAIITYFYLRANHISVSTKLDRA